MIRSSSPSRPLRFPTAALLAGTLAPLAAAEFAATDRQPTPAELESLPAVASPAKAAELLKEVTFPPEFAVSIFATPPAVNYPVFVAAAPDGTLYVSSDGNGSLDRKPHLGRVLRARDRDGDGQADEVKAFVPDVDSPRGLVWDQDRLYLVHPPDISVFFDRDGDGIAEERKTLVSGIAFTFKDRPADHSSNGLELGIDGWLYAAIGDFGFLQAVGTDGKKLQLRGGGVVRVRPDGSDLELYADGARNILEVAVSPLLDGFARDNTNDGGGWDVRLHHFSGYTQHGYPRLFKNFADEIIPPLADYGGGSGCGAAWIDEPGIPAQWNNAPFTADWGTSWVYHHGLKKKGATFAASQEPFAKLPRVTDLDVDANSAVYAASWKGASFTWVGPDVGFLVRATPKDFRPDPLPDFATAHDADLTKLLESPSHRRRLAAQRMLLRRWVEPREVAPLSAASVHPGLAIRQGLPHPIHDVVSLAKNERQPIENRVAAVFTAVPAVGTSAPRVIQELLEDATIAPWVFRAVTDRSGRLPEAWAKVIRNALRSPDARTRKEAIIALTRAGDEADIPAMLPLTADPDSVVAHTAVECLIRRGAADDCLIAVHDPATPPPVRTGALRVLQSLHRPEVALGLIGALFAEKNAERRAGLITALCRLHFQEGEWKGDSWGTRPDTRGPYYQPEAWSETPKIAAALHTALRQADSQEAAFIGRELARHRIPAGDALDLLIARAAAEPSLLPAIAAQLSEAEEAPASALPLLIRTATASDTPDAARAQAVMALVKTQSPDGWRAALRALPQTQKTKTENNLAEKARNAFKNSPHSEAVPEVFIAEAAQLAGDSSLWADVILLKMAARKVGPPAPQQTAQAALDSGWADPQRRTQILRAAAVARDASRAAQIVAALDDPNPEVAQAARETVKGLKLDPEKIRAEAQAPKVGDLGVNDVLDAVGSLRGDAARGEHIYQQVGCSACHTVKADEPLKGPFLGTIAKTYPRAALAEAILIPNKTLAQGFVAYRFELKDGAELDGFVVREAADAVTIRTITAEERTLPVSDIAKRERQERSLMPEGLAAGLTVKELASLLDYLQALPDQQ